MSNRSIGSLFWWVFTTPFTERVTVNVCGLDVPVIAVTVIRSPPTMTSNGKSVGLAAEFVHTALPLGTDTFTLASVGVMSWEMNEAPEFLRVDPMTPTWYGDSGWHTNVILCSKKVIVSWMPMTCCEISPPIREGGDVTTIR